MIPEIERSCKRPGPSRGVVLSTGAARASAAFPGSFFLLTALRPEMRELLREARRRGLTTSMDPGWDPRGQWGNDIHAMLPFIDVFLPNETEAMAIASPGTPEKVLAALSGDARTVVVKRGAEGCMAGNGNTALRCPAFKVKAVDVASARDIFDAGFLYRFLHGWGLEESVKFAGACGAISVSRNSWPQQETRSACGRSQREDGDETIGIAEGSADFPALHGDQGEGRSGNRARRRSWRSRPTRRA